MVQGRGAVRGPRGWLFGIRDRPPRPRGGCDQRPRARREEELADGVERSGAEAGRKRGADAGSDGSARVQRGAGSVSWRETRVTARRFANTPSRPRGRARPHRLDQRRRFAFEHETRHRLEILPGNRGASRGPSSKSATSSRSDPSILVPSFEPADDDLDLDRALPGRADPGRARRLSPAPLPPPDDSLYWRYTPSALSAYAFVASFVAASTSPPLASAMAATTRSFGGGAPSFPRASFASFSRRSLALFPAILA